MSTKLKLSSGRISTKRFNKLPAAVRRVLIAKDVIKRLDDKSFKVRKGYIKVYGKVKSNLDADAKTTIAKKQIHCEGCARGAMFMCAIGFRNTLNVCQLRDAEFDYDNYYNDSCSATEFIAKDFSKTQQSMIECAYELFDFGNASIRLMNSAIQFGNQYKNDEERLIAIMQNIINNNGTFKP